LPSSFLLYSARITPPTLYIYVLLGFGLNSAKALLRKNFRTFTKFLQNFISGSPYNTPFEHRFDFLSTNTNIFSTSRNFRSTNNNIFSNNNIVLKNINIVLNNNNIVLKNNNILQRPLGRKSKGHTKKHAESRFRNRHSKARAKNSIQKRLLKVSSLYG
jgi:hypothetical protein